MKTLFSLYPSTKSPSFTRGGPFVFVDSDPDNIIQSGINTNSEQNNRSEQVVDPEGNDIPKNGLYERLLTPFLLGHNDLRQLSQGAQGLDCNCKNWNKNKVLVAQWEKSVRYFLSLSERNGGDSHPLRFLEKIAGETALTDLLSKTTAEKVLAKVDARVAALSLQLEETKELVGAKTYNLLDLPEKDRWEAVSLYKYMLRTGEGAVPTEDKGMHKHKILEDIKNGMISFQVACFDRFQNQLSGVSEKEFFNGSNQLLLLQVNSLLKDSYLRQKPEVSALAEKAKESVDSVLESFLHKKVEQSFLENIQDDPAIDTYWDMLDDLIRTEIENENPRFEHITAQDLENTEATVRAKKAMETLGALSDSYKEHGTLNPEQVRVLLLLKESGIADDIASVQENTKTADTIRANMETKQVEQKRLLKERLTHSIGKAHCLLGEDSISKEKLSYIQDTLSSLEANSDNETSRIKYITREGETASFAIDEEQSLYKVDSFCKEVDRDWKKFSSSVKDSIRERFVSDTDDSAYAVVCSEILSLRESLNRIDRQNNIPSTEASTLLNKHEEDLKRRIEKRMLCASDFQLILDKGVSGALGVSDDYCDMVRSSRDALEKIVVPGIDSFIEPIDKKSSEEEQRRTARNMAKKISQYLSTENIWDVAKGTVDLQKISQHELAGMSIQNEFITAAMASIRGQVLDRISKKNKTEGNSNQSLLDLWSNVRTHNDSNKNGGIRALESDIAQAHLEQSKDEKLLDALLHDMNHEFEKKGWTNDELVKNAKAEHELFMTGKLNGKYVRMGSYQLHQIQLTGKPLYENLKDTFTSFTKKVDDIEKSIIENDAQGVHTLFNDLALDWGIEMPLIRRKIENIRSMLISVFGEEPDFIKDFLNDIDSGLKTVQKSLAKLSGKYNQADDKTLREALHRLAVDIDFDAGTFSVLHECDRSSHKKESYNKDQDGKYASYVNGIKILDDHTDVLTDEGGVDSTKTQFGQEWEERQEQTRKIFEESLKNVQRAGDCLAKDLDTYALKEDVFKKKYGINLDQGQKMLADYRSSEQEIHDMWGIYKDPDYSKKWLEDYRNGDESVRMNLIQELGSWEDFNASGKEMGDLAAKYIEFLGDWDDTTGWWKPGKYDGCKNYFDVAKKFAASTFGTFEITSLSLSDIGAVWSKFWEIRETLSKRSSDKVVADLGNRFTWGQTNKEFRRMGEDSEGQRISEYEGNYEDLELYLVKDYLYKTNDEDEARACMNILNKEGQLHWDDTRLWKTLMRLNSGVHFKIPYDKDHEDYAYMTQKVSDSVAGIWSSKVFKEWDTSREGNLKSQMDNWKNEFAEREKTEPNVKQTLSEMLKSWGNGEQSDDINSVKYEAFLRLAFENGKANGNPDPRLYFLIMGVTVRNQYGQTLLDPGIMQRFQDLIGVYPYIEFFMDKGTPKENGKIVVGGDESMKTVWKQSDFDIWRDQLGTGGGSFSPENKSIDKALSNFFYETLLMSDDSQGRAGRVISEKFDHDDGEVMITGWDAETVMTQLYTESQQNKKQTPDFWRNALKGYNDFFKEQARIIAEGDLAHGQDENWRFEKERRLEKTGQLMKASFAATLLLWENYGGKGDSRVQSFDPEEADKVNYTHMQKPNDSRKGIAKGLNVLFRKKGKSNFEELMTDRGRMRKGRTSDSKEIAEKTKAELDEVFKGELGNDIFGKKNSANIEEALKQYL